MQPSNHLESKTTFAIREATAADSWSIAAIHYASRQHGYKDLLPEHLLHDRSPAVLAAYWTEQLQSPVSMRGRIFLAYAGNQPAGFAVLVSNSEPAEIDRIYVMPTHIRKGVGAALISHCLELLKESTSRRLCVWVFEQNFAARRFYEAQGFTFDGNVRQSEPYPREVRYSMRLPVAYD